MSFKLQKSAYLCCYLTEVLKWQRKNKSKTMGKRTFKVKHIQCLLSHTDCSAPISCSAVMWQNCFTFTALCSAELPVSGCYLYNLPEHWPSSFHADTGKQTGVLLLPICFEYLFIGCFFSPFFHNLFTLHKSPVKLVTNSPC